MKACTLVALLLCTNCVSAAKESDVKTGLPLSDFDTQEKFDGAACVSEDADDVAVIQKLKEKSVREAQSGDNAEGPYTCAESNTTGADCQCFGDHCNDCPQCGSNKGLTWCTHWRCGQCSCNAAATINAPATATPSSQPTCGFGFTLGSGDVPGWGKVNGRGGGETVPSCARCGDLCFANGRCQSYECSQKQKKCNLNTEIMPTRKQMEGYHFCHRNGIKEQAPSAPSPICEDVNNDPNNWKVTMGNEPKKFKKCTAVVACSDVKECEETMHDKLKTAGITCYKADVDLKFEGYRISKPNGETMCFPCGQYESQTWSPKEDPNKSAIACGIAGKISEFMPHNLANKFIIRAACGVCADKINDVSGLVTSSLGSAAGWTKGAGGTVVDGLKKITDFRIPGLGGFR